MTHKTIIDTSRRKFLKLIGQGSTVIGLLTGCASSLSKPFDNSSATNSLDPSKTDLPLLAPPNDELDIKIGQMLLVGFRGLEVGYNHSIVRDIRDHHIGGVILFDYDIAQRRPVRNIKSPQQVKELVRALQAYQADLDPNTPLLIGIDYEGGIINRLPQKYGFRATVSHQYLGYKNNSKLTYREAEKMAQTLANLGINLNFSPVVDVNTNPRNPIIGKLKRSFSANPSIVTKHALEFIRAHHRYNILCTIKHFPGHGSSTADSHLGVVDVSRRWSNIELEPYRKLINTGVVDGVMTAHVFNNRLDSDYPATLSKPTITGMLREQLGYNGVIFSDDMQMKAIANHYGLETAIRKTIEAGVDIIVIGNNTGIFEPNIASRVATIIKRLVQNGTISETRIEASYQRILRLKQRL